jgi:hypothetical protein
MMCLEETTWYRDQIQGLGAPAIRAHFNAALRELEHLQRWLKRKEEELR